MFRQKLNYVYTGTELRLRKLTELRSEKKMRYVGSRTELFSDVLHFQKNCNSSSRNTPALTARRTQCFCSNLARVLILSLW